jgi:citrate lyase beta subunit
MIVSTLKFERKKMRHFGFLTPEEDKRLFLHTPVEFNLDSDKDLRAVALGATLYCPSIRPNLAEDILKLAKRGAGSIVMCLEDSIPDDRVEEGEKNIIKTLEALNTPDNLPSLPQLFIRVRNPLHLKTVAAQNRKNLSALTGFVFPKFEDISLTATDFVTELHEINADLELHGERKMLFMPVLESPILVFRETREAALGGIKDVLSANKDSLLAIRIGATDMSSSYGLRRSADLTVYDVHVVASVIADIVNTFGRSADKNVITGAVWEHFTARERLFKPQLRETLFHDDNKLRRELLTQGFDALIREISLDRANGLLGKTVIHPSHVELVHSFSVVTHEEYADAIDITSKENSLGGASASQYRNKMNEVKPHLAWAEKTLLRAKAFGVANAQLDFVDFLEVSTK